ncbi:hypothetical protein ACFVOK_09680 [Streptomyces sp. NPDC057798]|uniref:hypothetical protein n=1 Tax=Streptomyces sp. NPDC057798 TaxID=3346252 RepID=UPI003678BA15
MSAIIELSGTDVVHRARSGGLFTRDRVYAPDSADPTVPAPAKTVGAAGPPPTPPTNPGTTEAVT